MDTKIASRALRESCVRWVASLSIVLAGFSSPALSQGDPEGDGEWDPPPNVDPNPPDPYAWPLEAIHAAHLATGQILVFSQTPTARLWNQIDGGFAPVPYAENCHEFFCSGHAALKDGSIVVAGGGPSGPQNQHYGQTKTTIFRIGGPFPVTSDPCQQLAPWEPAGDMHYARWYPTCTGLSGKILVFGGDNWDEQAQQNMPALFPELFDPVTKTWSVINAPKDLGLYPYMYLLQNGAVFYAGPGAETAILHMELPTPTWTDAGNTGFLLGGHGFAVMYEPGKILKAGGSSYIPGFCCFYASELAKRIIDPHLGGQWESMDDMHEERADHKLVALPDGTVLAIGGVRNDGTYVMRAELFNPTVLPGFGQWQLMAAMEDDPRPYHAVAILLADARVLVAGGNTTGGPFIQFMSAEVFSPPYLFKGPRPVIVSAPAVIGYDTTFNVRVSGVPVDSIDKVSLVRLGAITHNFDQDQRYIPLVFTVVGGPTSPNLRVTAPANGNIAPPGYYMLFLVSEQGVPSVAAYVRADTTFVP